MNPNLTLMLRWLRQSDRDYRMIAWGYYLASMHELEPWERCYFDNVHVARAAGVSA